MIERLVAGTFVPGTFPPPDKIRGMVGVLVQLYTTGLDNLGLTQLPAPVEIGDLVALEQSEYRVYDVVKLSDEAVIDAMVKIEPVRLGIASV